MVALVWLSSLCLAKAPVRAQGPGSWWIWFHSRESKPNRGPKLLLRAKGGKIWSLEAAADATVIAYLENRSFPRMVRLAVGTHDKNRSLIRFDLPEKLAAKDLEKAQLVLDLELSKMKPSQKFGLDLHSVLEDWNERSITWATQPGIAKKALHSVELLPKKQILEIDLLPLVRSWLQKPGSNHGILIRQAGVLLPQAPSKKRLIADLRRQVGFLHTSEQALAQAKKHGRLVMTLVVSSQNRGAASTIEQLLLTQAFCSPDLLALVHRRFVPLRQSYAPKVYTHQRLSRGKDPLTPLGASSLQIKAPALLVSTARGKLLDSLQSIGTARSDVVHRFLLRALSAASPVSPLPEATSAQLLADGFLDAALAATLHEASPGAEIQRARIELLRGHPSESLACFETLDKKWRKLEDVRILQARAHMRLGHFLKSQTLYSGLATEGKYGAEATYRLAAFAWMGDARKETMEAFAALAKVPGPNPWALRAAARLAWPERMAWSEPMRELRPLADHKSTETPSSTDQIGPLVRRALLYLLDQQAPDGTWPVEAMQYRMAVSAFAAKALLVWRESMPADLKTRMRSAISRFEQRALTHLVEQDPKQASTFGATYLVDYFLEAWRRKPSKKSLARLEHAARFLIGGQCPNGAWSYSYAFGTRWRGGFGGWPRTTRGRTHSMNTGPALDFLLAARDAGAKIRKEPLARGLDVLAKMRSAPGVYTYTYPDPISFQKSDQSIARGPTCELALHLGKKASTEDLLTTLRRFMELRAALRTPVKLDPSWSSPHNFSSYFFFYAYYHGALAWKALQATEAHRKEATRALGDLRQDLLQVVEVDGTWLDFPDLGKPYATAAALLVLGLSR